MKLETITLEKPGVRPIFYSELTSSEKAFFDNLEAFNPPYLLEKMLMENEVESAEEFNEYFKELKRYFAIAKATGKKIAMTSTKIDAVWHQFILFTREYHAFSQKFFGKYFHHSPNIPSRNNHSALHAELDNFIDGYHAMYGPIPKIWTVN